MNPTYEGYWLTTPDVPETNHDPDHWLINITDPHGESHTIEVDPDTYAECSAGERWSGASCP